MPENSLENPEGKLETKSWSEANTQVLPGRIPSVYANNVSLGFTNWDAWIQFGHIIGQEDKLLIEPKVRVTMSLEHAKAFLTALQDSIAKFEEQFGEIKLFVQKEQPDSAK